MSNFVGKINILRACVDNINKTIYNVKCNLHIFCSFALLILIAIGVVPSSAIGYEGSIPLRSSVAEESTFVSFESLPSSDDRVRMSLSVAAGTMICGMKTVIRYNSDAAAFKEIVSDRELVEHGGVLSFSESDGEITIIVDFGENYTGCGIGVVAFEGLGRDICFDVYVESLYVWEENTLVFTELTQGNRFSVVIQAHGVDDESFGLSAEINNDDETTGLTLCAVAPSRCFAAGFDVYIVEISGLESQCFSVLGVLAGSAEEERLFSYTVSLSSSEEYCVIIKPVVYFGNRATTGREIVIIIDNGYVIS